MTPREADALFNRLPLKLLPLSRLLRERLDRWTPSDAQHADALNRADHLGRLLVGASGVGGKNSVVIGSIAKRTANAPLRDIDLLVELDEAEWLSRGDRKAPATVIRELAQRLECHYRPLIDQGHVDVRKQTHSVRVLFTKEHRVDIDVVPAFAVGRGVFEIPERGAGRWVQTSPSKQLETLTSLDAAAQPVRRAIRLLKLWRQQRQRLRSLPSYALEILAMYARRHGAHCTEVGLFESVLRWMIETDLREPVSLVPQPTRRSAVVIMDTGVRENNVAGGIYAAERDEIVAIASRTLETLEDAAARVGEGKTVGVETGLRAVLGE